MSVKIVRGRGVSAVPADLIKGGAVHQVHPSKGFAGIGFRLVHDNAARTVRGGSFYYGPDNARAADRDKLGPDNYCDTFGFRLVREGT